MRRSSTPKLVQCSLLFIACIVLHVNGSCNKSQKMLEQNSGIDTIGIRIDAGKTFQVMDNFGASDAWACQYVGLWSMDVKNKIADLLFSRQTDAQGDPVGIGLSAWRFNVGAGSTAQGAASGIKDPWRRAESFLQADGSYDFDKAGGQSWFLQAAKQRGVTDFIGFCNSAPYFMTKNGLTYSTGGKSNLAVDKYGEFADFLVQVIEGLRVKTGIVLNYISPVNEPQWDWSDGGQEGSPYLNTEITGVTKVLDDKLTKADLATKISIAEAGQIDYLLEGSNKPQRGAQIQAFFSRSSSTSLLGLPHVDHSIAAHSYFTTSPYGDAVTKREKVYKELQAAKMKAGLKDLRYWMSEYCILGDNHGEIDGNHRDLGMNAALYMAKVIHMDLTYANASSWQWWLAISAYDYKDGLIYVDKTTSTGNYYESKMLWTLGNYSRFIRPGYIRINTALLNKGGGADNILLSAFKDPASSKVVLVIVNEAKDAQVLKFTDSDGFVPEDKYLTSGDYNLKHFKVEAKDLLKLPPKSVTTFTGYFK